MTSYCANCVEPLSQQVSRWHVGGREYFLYKCNTCELIQLSNVAKRISKNLYANVSTDKYIKEVNPQLRLIYSLSFGKRILNAYNRLCYQSRYSQVSSYRQSGQVLDIGCADGQFLEFFSTDWQLWGVEVNKDFVSRFKKRLPSAKIYTGKIEEFKGKNSSFDVITLWHVFEHLENPHQIMRKIHKLLKPGGLLFIEVPHGNSIVRKLFGSEWQLLMFPQHLFFWTTTAWNYLAKRHDFKILTTKYLGIVSSGPASMANFLRRTHLSSHIASFLGLASLPIWMLVSFIFYTQRDNVLVVFRKK